MKVSRSKKNGSGRKSTHLRVEDMYGSMGTVKLLTPAKEFELVELLDRLRTRILRLLQPLCKDAPQRTPLEHFDQILSYYRKLRSSKRKATRRIEKLLDEYEELKGVLVVANLPWVTKLARTHKQQNILEEDLFQEGVCGLLKAIDRFEPQRGLRLMTYCTWYIREAMQQLRAKQSHPVSLSTHDHTLLRRLEVNRASFQHTYERQPSANELGEFVGRNAQIVSRLQFATSPPASLERGSEVGNIPVVVEDPTREFDHQEEVQLEISRLLEALPSRERMIVSRRFGLEGQEPVSLEVLGIDLKVSKERIRQLQRQAIQRMQQKAAEVRPEKAQLTQLGLLMS